MTNELKKFPNDNVTCISPWYELRIDADGSMRSCHAVSQEYAEKSDLSFLEWFRHGDKMIDIRNSITTGDPYPGCSACYKNEKQNLISFRQRRNIQSAIYSGTNFSKSLEQSPSYKRMTGKIEKFYPAFLHVTLSNLCNLSCRMCFPAYSSQLTNAYKKIGLVDDNTPMLLDWTNDSNKWNEFLDLVKDNDNLMSLHFMGGEPLYHKRFIEFIDWCIVNDKTDFHLTVVTNGTIHNQSLLEKLKLFKSIQVEISLENLHETNNYIRLNSDFEQVRENILNIFDCLGTSSVVIRSVPQALSIMHYDTLIDFAIENKISIDNNVIYKPEYLKCFVLPKEIKDKLTAHLQHKYANILGNESNDITTQISRIRTFEFNLKRHIESLLIQLNEPEPSNVEDLRKQFIKYNDKMDSVSGTSFKEMYPELLNFYAKYSTI